MNFEDFLTGLYKFLLALSRKRGEHTLARIDSLLFKRTRQVYIDQNKKVSITLPPDPHFFRYFTKTHETHVALAISRLVKDGDVVLDIGANVGYFSAYAAIAVGKIGRVFCFEPEAKNFSYLQSNCERMQQFGLNCSASNFAVSCQSGSARLKVHQYSTYHTLEEEYHTSCDFRDTQTINTISIDEWSKSQSIQRISLIKIDTEGHEAKVLEGARNLFGRRAIDFTILECRSEVLAKFVDDFSQEFGLYQLVWDGKMWHQTRLQSLDYKTECLLSTQPISASSLC